MAGGQLGTALPREDGFMQKGEKERKICVFYKKVSFVAVVAQTRKDVIPTNDARLVIFAQSGSELWIASTFGPNPP